ncbi:hypothetical protein [Actinophytocola sediminis]
MIELAAAGLGIAAQLLFRFLDGPDKQLQRQKLELEVEEFARQRQVTKISDEQLDAIRNSVVSELHLLVDQTPGLEWKSSKLVRDKFTVERDAAALESSEKIMQRLRLAVDARRKLIEGAAKLQAADTPDGWADIPPPAPPGPPTREEPTTAGQDWVQGEAPVVDKVPDRLSRLARRIEERRK